MQIGSIGSVMSMPYVYNTNSVNRASMNPISAIPEDGTKGRVDYKGLVSEDGLESMNPLKRGESRNFADIISSQMALSNQHKAALMKAVPSGAEDNAVFE